MNPLDRIEMRKVRRIHFVGIGGIGMSGIAEVLLHEGYTISGSDIAENAMTDHLESLGAKISIGHDAKHIQDADVLVISSAISPQNVEVEAAKALRIPIIHRSEMLAELMRFRSGIAISGAHGKTTTTSLIANLLADAGLDPTFVIGGRLNCISTNARLGQGRYLIAEADESDASFLRLHPSIVVVTNIDNDHLDTYHQSIDELRSAFIQFINQIPFYGFAVLCLDDPGIQTILSKISRPVITYGCLQQADVTATQIKQIGTVMYFNVRRPNKPDLPIQLNLAGEHHVLNALAAIIIAGELGISDEVICQSLKNFAGVGRRFQPMGHYPLKEGSALFIDDYGHHPKKLAATIKAARNSWPNQRIIMMFQPHRYTRTRDLFEDFATVLMTVDDFILLDIYSAGESPIEGITSQKLLEHIHQKGYVGGHLASKTEDLPHLLQTILKAEDIVFAQGAGSISAIAKKLIETATH